MATIYERVHSRRDLDDLRAARAIDQLAMKLNEECIEVQIPVGVTANSILMYTNNGGLLLDLLARAAQGESVQADAIAFLSDTGFMTTMPGYEPPKVDQFEVANALYYVDGTER